MLCGCQPHLAAERTLTSELGPRDKQRKKKRGRAEQQSPSPEARERDGPWGAAVRKASGEAEAGAAWLHRPTLRPRDRVLPAALGLLDSPTCQDFRVLCERSVEIP